VKGDVSKKLGNLGLWDPFSSTSYIVRFKKGLFDESSFIFLLSKGIYFSGM